MKPIHRPGDEDYIETADDGGMTIVKGNLKFEHIPEAGCGGYEVEINIGEILEVFAFINQTGCPLPKKVVYDHIWERGNFRQWWGFFWDCPCGSRHGFSYGSGGGGWYTNNPDGSSELPDFCETLPFWDRPETLKVVIVDECKEALIDEELTDDLD